MASCKIKRNKKICNGKQILLHVFLPASEQHLLMNLVDFTRPPAEHDTACKGDKLIVHEVMLRGNQIGPVISTSIT